MINQRTIAKEVSITGIGIHSGKKVTLKLYPAESDTGILFRRSDIPSSKTVKACAKGVGPTQNNTTLGDGPDAIHTVVQNIPMQGERRKTLCRDFRETSLEV